jgi:hypothetical protein
LAGILTNKGKHLNILQKMVVVEEGMDVREIMEAAAAEEEEQLGPAAVVGRKV